MSSSSSNISIIGSFRKAFVAVRFSRESKMHGKRIRLVANETMSVIEIRIPNATVPPKLEKIKIAKPKKE